MFGYPSTVRYVNSWQSLSFIFVFSRYKKRIAASRLGKSDNQVQQPTGMGYVVAMSLISHFLPSLTLNARVIVPAVL